MCNFRAIPLNANGFDVRCWRVFNEELVVKVVESGADAMTINFPDKLTKYFMSTGYIKISETS